MKKLALLLLALGVFLGGWAFWWEPRRLVTRETSAVLDCWQGPLMRVAEQSIAGNPVLVVLLGDFVIQGVKGGTFVPPEAIAAQLAKLKAKRGVYAVIGNHDAWLYARRVAHTLQSNGITVLDDASVELHNGPAAFWLAGVSDFMTDYGDDYAIGHIHQDGKRLFVTAGLGTSIIPVRFRVPPEIVFLTITGRR